MEGGEILESWKEIAGYLRRSVATCQRWEVELGLPIHRLDGTPKARVFAYKEELDRWIDEKLHHADISLDDAAEPPQRARRRAGILIGSSVMLAVLAVAGWRLLPKRSGLPPAGDKAAAAGAAAATGSIATEREVDLGRITTRSPEALRFYIEGCKLLLWPSGNEGWRTARSDLKKAIEIDPGFAMAYSVLASSYGPGEDQTKNMAKAAELSDSVSRRERLMIEGNHLFYIEKEYAKAIQAYKKALKVYPNDDMVNRKLYDLYVRVQDRKSAFMHQEFLYEKNKFDRILLGQYALQCESLGFFDKGIEAYRLYLEKAPEDHAIRERLYNLYWQSGRYEQALEEADRLRAAGADRKVDKVFPLYLMGNYEAAEQLCRDYARGSESRSVWGARDWLQNIYITQGKLAKAKEQIVLGLQEEEKLVEAGRVNECHGRICLRGRLAEIFMIERKWTEAMNEAEMAWALAVDIKHEAYQVDALTLKAEIYLQMGLVDKAQETAEKIREVMQGKTPDAMRSYYFVAGEIELRKGNSPRAMDWLKKAQDLELQIWGGADGLNPRYAAALASAHLQSGKLRSARKELEKIPLLISGRQLEGYAYARNFYDLGKICDDQGDHVKAIEYLQKFLDLWKDADPRFTEVEEAKARLVRLKAS